jgi:hypothetical protein
VIVTERAVTVPDLDADPIAETHWPVARVLAEAETLCVMTVEDVIVTATWPLDGFCTSSVSVPMIAATVPEAELRLAGGVGVVAAPAAPAAAKLAGATQTIPTRDTAPSARTVQRGRRLRGPCDTRFGETGALGLVITTPCLGSVREATS